MKTNTTNVRVLSLSNASVRAVFHNGISAKDVDAALEKLKIVCNEIQNMNWIQIQLILWTISDSLRISCLQLQKCTIIIFKFEILSFVVAKIYRTQLIRDVDELPYDSSCERRKSIFPGKKQQFKRHKEQHSLQSPNLGL